MIIALGKVLKITGIAKLIVLYSSWIRSPGCYILAYHRIADEADESVSATAENFSKQISFLNKYFSIIPLERLVDSIKNREALPLNSAVITFDDGYKEVFTNAYPILKKNNIPATVFITTDYIEQVPSSKFQVPSNVILAQAKNLNMEHGTWNCSMLSWDDIREMGDNNISIGSHTVSHPALSGLSDDEMEKEVRESKEIIRRHTGIEAVSFAYPYGGRKFFDDRIKAMLEKYGYKCGCSTIYGTNDLESDPFELKRIPINYYEDETVFMVKIFGLLNPLARFMDRFL